MATVEEVWASRAGMELFNGLTRMNLVDRNERAVLFSRRHELTLLIIGLLLEAGYQPEEFL